MRSKTPIILALALCSCDPPGQHAGEVDDSSTGTATATNATEETEGDSADGTEAPPVGSDAEWVVDIGPEGMVFLLVATPDGIALSVQEDPALGVSAELREYAAAGEELWSTALPDAWVGDLTRLDDGRFIAAGSTDTAAAWRLSSAGVLEDTLQIPIPDGPYAFTVAQPHPSGVLLAASNGMSSVLFGVPLDFSPGGFENPSLFFSVQQGAPTASGDTLLLGIQDLATPIRWEVDAMLMGSGVSGPSFGGLLVGSGPELYIVRQGGASLILEHYDSGEKVEVLIPGLPLDTVFSVDHRDRFVVAFQEHFDDGSVAHVIEFDLDGTIHRDAALVPTAGYLQPGAVAFGYDDAVYVVTRESGPEHSGPLLLHRFAPL